jgi:hypothetical protein
MNTFTRYLSILVHRKHVQIYALSTSSLFHLIPTDIWLLIANEWLDHIRSLLLLEIAVGKRNMENWIYGLSRRVSIPCEMNVEKIEGYASWKQFRGLEKFDKITVRCKNTERDIKIPWNNMKGVDNLIILSRLYSTIENKIPLQELLQIQPQLQKLSIPINFLKVSDDNIVPHMSLQSLVLTKYPWTCEMKWRRILASLPHIVPMIETIDFERCKLLSFHKLIHVLQNLPHLKTLMLECSISSDELQPLILPLEHRQAHFEEFPLDGEDEGLLLQDELHTHETPTEEHPLRISSTTVTSHIEDDSRSMILPWEKVTIHIETNSIIRPSENKTLFSALSRCANLKSLSLQANLFFPRSLFTTFPWNALTSLTLKAIGITSSQLCCILESVGHQLENLTLQSLYHYPREHEDDDDEFEEFEEFPEENEVDSCRWVTLLHTHCKVLQSLQLISTVFQEEPKMISLLTPNDEIPMTSAFANSLRYFELMQVNYRSMTDATMIGRLLKSYQQLECIHIRLDEVQCYSDVMDILFTCCNVHVLKKLEFLRHRLPIVPSKMEKYKEHMHHLSHELIFPALESLLIRGVIMVEESIPYLLSHAPMLEEFNIQVQLLRKKTVTMAMHSSDTLPGERVYARKDAYFEYDSHIHLCSPSAIRALLQPPHVTLLPKYFRKGGIFPFDPNVNASNFVDYWWLPIAVRHRIRWNDKPPSSFTSWIHRLQDDSDEDNDEEENDLPAELLIKAETVFVESISEEEYVSSRQIHPRKPQKLSQAITRNLFKKDKNKSLPYVYEERKNADGNTTFHIEQTFIQYVHKLKRMQGGEERATQRWRW